MKPQYELLMSLRTCEGFEYIGQFELGIDRYAAFELFFSLQQIPLADSPALHIDLVESHDEMPVRVKTIGCNLEQLGQNCQLITWTLFRLKTLRRQGLIKRIIL